MRLLLRNSSTSRKGAFVRRRLFHWFLTGVALVCSVLPAHAIDPDRAISQYIRDRWASDKGFPGGSVSAITQTADGYLWIGTEKGLIRFDGLNFQLFDHAVPSSLPIGPIQELMADGDGNLWIVLQNTQILRYHDGKFELGRGEVEFGITSVGRRRDGTVLLSSLALGTLAYRAGKYEILTSSSELAAPEKKTTEADTRNTRLSLAIGFRPQRLAPPNSAVTAMAETADGRLWLGTRDKGLFYMSQGRVFAAGKGLPNSQINCILAVENQELWIGTDTGMVRWNGTALTSSGIPDALRHTRVFSMIRDRNSNIWVGAAAGLIRVNPQGVSTDRTGPQTTRAVTALFEDREGNLWTGGLSGIQRLRDSAFVTYTVADGLPSERNGPVYVDQQGRTWFAPLQGGLQWSKGRQHGSVTEAGLARDVVYSISGRENELWVGRQRGGLTSLRTSGGSFIAKTYTQADGLAQNSVYVVRESRDGTVWAGTLSGGVSRFDGRRFRNYTTATGIASNTVTSIRETRDGSIWFGTPNGLNSLSNGRWTTYTTKDGLPSEDVNCLFEDSSGTLWTGTSNGLALFNSGHVQVPSNLPALLRGKIFGVAEDQLGWFWIATADHVLRAERNKIASGTLGPSDLREYGVADGLRSTEGVKRSMSVISDPSGRIWFSLSRGLSVVDPSRATDTSAPAIPQIQGLSADGSRINLQDPAHIPPSPRRITFTYTGLSLAVPEQVRFRYFLENFDRGWSEPVTAREAVYTNLGAGSYRFRVVASNSEHQWNGSEAAVRFVIEPLFWETWWFRATCFALVLLLVWCAHRYRLYQLTRQFNMRFEERVGERTRIARDLHDTLLQSFHGLLLRFQAVSNLLPARPQEAKERLEDAIDQAAQAITEGRDAVQGLRASAMAPNDLAQALSALGQELGSDGMSQHSPEFRVEVEGAPRELQAILRDEVYRIAGEALRNAFRHAQARKIELEIHYDERQLRLRIRDDGKGMETQVLDSAGRPGHWGLRGMRERAKVIGGNLELWSNLESGTEIELTIPASIAYAASPPRRRSWFSGKRAATHD